MDTIFDGMFEVQAAPLRYHMDWPASNDPAYLYNPTEANARRGYYGVNGIPVFFVDGKNRVDPYDPGGFAQFYSAFPETVAARLALPRDITLELTHFRDTDSVYVQVHITVVNSISGSNRLFMARGRTQMRLGTWGNHSYIFRDMMPSTSGDLLTISAPGEEQYFEYSYAITGGEPEKLITTVWVQNYSTKEVLDAGGGLIYTPDVGVLAGDLPIRIILGQNAPNPFNPQTAIPYSLDRAGEVNLSVFSPAGRLIRQLVKGHTPEGTQTVTWDGRDQSGTVVGSGVYYYRLDSEKSSQTKKMILIR